LLGLVLSVQAINAFRLKGELLLMVGEVDDNVDPTSTMQVINALVKANKEFELIVLPVMIHTFGGKYDECRRRDFIVKNLLGSAPPDCYRLEPYCVYIYNNNEK